MFSDRKIKIPTAKEDILASNSVVKEIDDSKYGALCHAIAHVGATVHVEKHVLGLPMYELTAIIFKDRKKRINMYRVIRWLVKNKLKTAVVILSIF